MKRSILDRNKMLQLSMIFIFIILICMPQVIFFFVKSKIPVDNSENRKLATKPEFTFENLKTFPIKYEKYYTDHLPFRGILRTAYAKLNYDCFNDPSSNRVLIGKNDGSKETTWLFFKNDNDNNDNEVKDAQGKIDFSKEKKEKYYNNMIEQTKLCSDNNIQLFYTICPDKANIYKDKLPDNVKIYNENSRTDKLVDWLNSEKNLTNLIYPRNELKKARENYNTYCRQDTHWNNYGAFIEFCAIMKKIEPNNNIDFENVEAKKGKLELANEDLTKITGIKNVFKDENYNVKYLEDKKFSKIVLNKEVQDSNYYTIITQNDNPIINKTIMIIGDSYRSAMIQYFAKTYKTCISIHRYKYKPQMVRKYKPDIIVLENIERYTAKNALLFDLKLDDK